MKFTYEGMNQLTTTTEEEKPGKVTEKDDVNTVEENEEKENEEREGSIVLEKLDTKLFL